MDNGNELYVYQVSGQRAVAHNPKRRFNHHMPTGNKECCPYVNTDCSMKADKNYSVMLVLSFSRNGDQRKYGETTVKVPCPAGGYVVAKGTIDQFSYEVFDADHNHIEVPIRETKKPNLNNT
ncbi:hypothetical protein INT45_001095 [Circinella minor]|uniref:Uncharacterized protein n=1 Tax=Circinella minor TaxID=1195481 RepID=A0A8H7VS43_9FUNG|nr:hypothetical protein INT45_001095 [Circinella minor]